jgi:hypothetical protein
VKLKRRDALKLSAGALLARPVLVVEAEAAVTLPAAQAAAAPAAAGRFLDARELALLDAVSETILPADDHSPGARAAGVASYIDAQLAEKDPKVPDWATERQEAKAHLAALDAASRQTIGKGFVEASADERASVLTKASADEQDPKTPEGKAFKWAKEQTARAYYSSKIGIHQEIGYKGNTLQVEYAGEEPR